MQEQNNLFKLRQTKKSKKNKQSVTVDILFIVDSHRLLKTLTDTGC